MQRDPRSCFEWSRGAWGALVRTSCSLPSGCRSCWARCWTLWITCTNWTSSTGDQGARLLQEESTTSPWASLPVGGTEGGRCGPHSQDEGVHPPGAPPRLTENAPQQGTSRGSPAPRSCEVRAGRGAGLSARAGSRHQPTQDGRSRRGHGRASLQSCGPRRNPRSRLWGSGKGFGSSDRVGVPSQGQEPRGPREGRARDLVVTSADVTCSHAEGLRPGVQESCVVSSSFALN